MLANMHAHMHASIQRLLSPACVMYVRSCGRLVGVHVGDWWVFMWVVANASVILECERSLITEYAP